jgi:hypothetical protein
MGTSASPPPERLAAPVVDSFSMLTMIHREIQNIYEPIHISRRKKNIIRFY